MTHSKARLGWTWRLPVYNSGQFPVSAARQPAHEPTRQRTQQLRGLPTRFLTGIRDSTTEHQLGYETTNSPTICPCTVGLPCKLSNTDTLLNQTFLKQIRALPGKTADSWEGIKEVSLNMGTKCTFFTPCDNRGTDMRAHSSDKQTAM